MTGHPCANCGESLFSDERFCPACGSDSGSAVAVATPPSSTPGAGPPTTPPDGASPGGHADTISPRTQVGEATIPCSKCGYGLAAIERFCPKCGTARPGQEHLPRGRAASAWAEVLDRLKEATRGRYEVIRELGRGGMAAVYLAHEPALNRKVAIKIMKPSLLLDDLMVERFLREARTMASFHHPNIVTIHAVESVNDLHYFVMQYVAGRALDGIIRDAGQLPVAAMQGVMFQAGAALTYAHRAGVIHRDIKPGNILIDEQGNSIVTDFGIAKVADLGNTSTTGPMGTPIYMSPEQCSGTPLGAASDQYALGNVAYEMLTGRPPFMRETPIALAMAITAETPKPIKQFRADCPPDIEAAVLKMLAKKPEDRWSTLTEATMALGGDHLAEDDPVRDFLASLAKAQPAPSTQRLTPRTPRTSAGTSKLTGVLRRGARVRLYAGLALLVGIVAVPAVLYVRGRAGRSADPTSDSSNVRRPDSTLAPVAPVAPPAQPGGPTVAETITARLAAARAAVGRRDWTTAERELGVVLALDAGNRDARALMTQVRRELPAAGGSARRDTQIVAVAPPATQPLPPAPSPAAAQPAPPAPPPPAVPPPRVDRSHEVRQAITQYEQAINARNLAQLKLVYPGMKPDQEAQWRDLFGKEIERLQATVSVRSIADRGDFAEASFLLTLGFKPRRDQPQTAKLGSSAMLRLESGAWKIVSLTTRPE